MKFKDERASWQAKTNQEILKSAWKCPQKRPFGLMKKLIPLHIGIADFQRVLSILDPFWPFYRLWDVQRREIDSLYQLYDRIVWLGFGSWVQQTSFRPHGQRFLEHLGCKTHLCMFMKRLPALLSGYGQFRRTEPGCVSSRQGHLGLSPQTMFG